jgi:hypothetical protein
LVANNPAVLLAPVSEPIVINMDNPDGDLVRLPVSGSREPYFPEQPDWIRVKDLGAPGHEQTFVGDMTRVYFGFTPETRDQYGQNNDVPFLNSSGQPTAEGKIEADYIDTSSDKPSEGTAPLYAWKPSGQNVVFKVEGRDSNQPDFYTKTYFDDGQP